MKKLLLLSVLGFGLTFAQAAEEPKKKACCKGKKECSTSKKACKGAKKACCKSKTNTPS